MQSQLARLLGPAAQRLGLRSLASINVGRPEDYRAPDWMFTEGRPTKTFVPAVTIVVEVVSPNDETWAKLDFHFDHGVAEMLIVNPVKRSVDWLLAGTTTMEHTSESRLLGLSAVELADRIDWPPPGAAE